MKFFSLVLLVAIAAAVWDGVAVERTSAADITLQVGTNPETVAKVDVVRVSTNEKNRQKRALLGLAIGAAVFVAGAGDVDNRRCLIAGAGGAAGGGMGALVGAETAGSKTVYRRS